MADYLVTGKKGNGKSLICINKMRQALLEGRPVATNLDIDLEKLLPAGNRTARYFRIPDYPTRLDLDAIGIGNEDKSDESKNGILVLDECANWMNARTFSDKSRMGVLEWLTYSRKLGWDTYLLTQHEAQVDKQAREALCEYHVTSRRLDRIRVPFMPFRFPKMFVYFVRLGHGQSATPADKWLLFWWEARRIFDAYDTRQVFSTLYPHTIHSVLPPWHTKGRFEPEHVPLWKRAKAFLFAFVRSLVQGPPAVDRPPLKPKLPVTQALMRLPPDARPLVFHKVFAHEPA